MAGPPVEQCQECGFVGSQWSTTEALRTIRDLPARWADAIDGLTDEQLHRRPIDQMWSIAEYTDHVREVLFGMRFLLDTAVANPGVDLGASPESRFDPEPRRIDVAGALDGLSAEAELLADSVDSLPFGQRSAWVKLDGERVDIGWIARHAVHDVTHHLNDVARLRDALR